MNLLTSMFAWHNMIFEVPFLIASLIPSVLGFSVKRLPQPRKTVTVRSGKYAVKHVEAEQSERVGLGGVLRVGTAPVSLILEVGMYCWSIVGYVANCFLIHTDTATPLQAAPSIILAIVATIAGVLITSRMIERTLRKPSLPKARRAM